MLLKLFARVFAICFLVFYSYYATGQEDTASMYQMLDKAKKIYNSDPDSAIVLFRQVLKVSMELRHEEAIGESSSYLTEALNNKGKNKEAYDILLEIQNYSKQQHFKIIMPSLLTSMAVLFDRWGNNDSAAYYYHQAIVLTERIGNPLTFAPIYNNYGALLIKVGEYKLAIEYLNKAKKTAALIKDLYQLSLALLNTGSAYSSIGAYKTAEDHLLQALSISRKGNIVVWEFMSLGALGRSYYLQKRYDDAIKILLEAIAISKGGDPFYKNKILTLIGQVYYTKGNIPQAQYYLEMSKANAEALGMHTDIIESNRLLSEVYTKQGLYKQALNCQLAYTRLKDSLDNAQIKQNVGQLEIKFRTAQKDKEIAVNQLRINRQEGQIKEQHMLIISISAGALLVTAILLMLYILYRNNQHKQHLQAQKIQFLEQQQQIDQLKAMMKGEEKERTRIAQELHDGIGSILANLKMNVTAFKEDYPVLEKTPAISRISTLLNSAATEVRRTAHNLMPNELVRQSFKEALLHFCDRHNSNQLQIVLQYHVPEPLNKSAELFLYRIIQELVQNIVKHAQASYAAIQILLHENELSFTVEDNGIGFNLTEQHNGTGLYNIQSRIEALNGYFSLDTASGIGTTVHIKLDQATLKNFQ